MTNNEFIEIHLDAETKQLAKRGEYQKKAEVISMLHSWLIICDLLYDVHID